MRLIFLLFLTIVLSCSTTPGESADSVETSTGETVIFLSRHAEKGSGENPQLLEVGRKRAQRLANLLKDENIAAVYATDFRRTQSTARPVAKRFGKVVRKYSASGAASTLTENWLKEHRGKTILVVGHSNTVPGLVNALIGENRYADIDEEVYDKLFRVSIDTNGRADVRVLSSN
ncbi:histidine phosphatase family protein [Lewinellaceae bacterium SD302]|nr:histidine phosphatase family protein [Lewinellaceae bacterium SD302]